MDVYQSLPLFVFTLQFLVVAAGLTLIVAGVICFVLCSGAQKAAYVAQVEGLRRACPVMVPIGGAILAMGFYVPEIYRWTQTWL